MAKTSLVTLLRPYTLYFAWVVALIATLGSLFLSEVMNFMPCSLCWFQRIFMYPLAIVLGIACFKQDLTIRAYALPLSIIGALLSSYHYAQQKVPGFAEMLPCTKGIPCNVDYLDWFGVITIPFMALVAFLLIIFLLWITPKEA